MRLLLVTPIGILLAFLVFWLMQWMIQPKQQNTQASDDVAMVDFIRAMKDSQSEDKQRDIKEPPKPKIPPMMQVPSLQKSAPNKMDISMPNLSTSLASFKGDAMGGMLAGYGFGDSDVIPLVQVEPRYPPQAISRKIEGYVVVRLKISKLGSVEEVEVINAKPKGVFEREAIKAAWRYRFKPKLEDGKPVPQVATLPFEFNLDK
jgi:protein TonB